MDLFRSLEHECIDRRSLCEQCNVIDDLNAKVPLRYMYRGETLSFAQHYHHIFWTMSNQEPGELSYMITYLFHVF